MRNCGAEQYLTAKRIGAFYFLDMSHTLEGQFMTTSQTPLLTEIAAGHHGPPIPSHVRAYFAQRLRLREFNFILDKFVIAQREGLTKAILARRIQKAPELINRWLASPSNLTLDTSSELLLGIC